YARQFDKALDQARKTYDLDPNLVTSQNWMCHSLDVNGMYAESLAISEKAARSNRSLEAPLGYAYAQGGRRPEAEAVLQQWSEIESASFSLFAFEVSNLQVVPKPLDR